MVPVSQGCFRHACVICVSYKGRLGYAMGMQVP